jgi:hypothetical protein
LTWTRRNGYDRGGSVIKTPLKPLAGGLLSGIVLGLFLKIIQSITNLKVYTLLLNVDYVPFLKSIHLPEIVEFILHLMISIILAFGVNLYITKKDLTKERIIGFVMKVGLIVGLLLYPTTYFSERTPEITSIYSFLFWMAGHGLYGAVLGKLLLYDKRG